MKRLLATALALCAFAHPAQPGRRTMTGGEIRALAQAVIPGGKDRAGWAADIHAALDANGIRPAAATSAP